MKTLCVFCGSSNGRSEKYREGAIALGKVLAERGITLIYGGASVGIMGTVADTVLEHGGQVIGVIPEMLNEKEIAHPNLTELHVVDSMHARKAKMAELADGFVALPGGPGTLEEFFEIFTWAQLGEHYKPCGLLNIHHYYDPIISLFDHMVEQQFMKEEHRSIAIVASDPETLLEKFNAYEPPHLKKWINKEQT
ncbi:TIGR00730 family Rossman fold protein [Bacillus tianshenii]|nr:TIGR00730 family Rossman fold protein [Bacillus tianshenii]